MGGFSHKQTKAIVNIDARIVNIDTAEILGVAEGHGESSRSSTSLLGGGGNWHGFGGGAVDFGNSDFQQTILGEAVKAAVDQMSSGLIADSSKLQVRTIVVSVLVAAVDSGQIVLNVGAKAGLKVGDQLSVERVTKEIKDPATGQVIRRLTNPIGIVRVTDSTTFPPSVPPFRARISRWATGQNRHAIARASELTTHRQADVIFGRRL